MASTMARVVDTNDSGNHTSGTLRDNAWLQSIFDAIENNFKQSTPYTPTWGNSGTANTIGNGSVTGSYFQFAGSGGLVVYRIRLTWGSSTTSGSGVWSFTVPVTSDSFWPGNGPDKVVAQDSSAGPAFYRGHAIGNSTTTIIVGTNASPVVSYSGTQPFTWASGDILDICGCYWAA